MISVCWRKKQTKLCRVWNLSNFFHASSLAMLIFLYNIFRPLIGLGHRAGNIRLGFFKYQKVSLWTHAWCDIPRCCLLLGAFLHHAGELALIAIHGQGRYSHWGKNINGHWLPRSDISGSLVSESKHWDSRIESSLEIELVMILWPCKELESARKQKIKDGKSSTSTHSLFA